VQYAVETLQIELYRIRGLIRQIHANEHSIMGAIPHDNYISQEASLVKAIAHLQSAEQGESPATAGNSDYTAALEEELSHCIGSDDFDFSNSVIHEVATRLNSVVKAQQNCA
jgi:hypothetical protein